MKPPSLTIARGMFYNVIRPCLLCSLLLLYASIGVADGPKPMEALEHHVEKAVRVLEDPRYADGRNRTEQREKLCTLAREGFDFTTFIRLSLVHDLEKFTPEEETQFTELFIRFLCRFYITQLQARYNSEQVLFRGQTFLDRTRAQVHIAVLWRNVEIPLTVSMTRTNATWKAYDVHLFGIGAVQNYRQQIHEILKDNTPSELIALVKDKLSQNPP